jgi:hypothetical protein
MLIEIAVTSFGSPELRKKFAEAQESAALEDIFQVFIDGQITCRELTVERATDGLLLNANGYGSHGFSKCRLDRAILIAFETLTTPRGSRDSDWLLK